MEIWKEIEGFDGYQVSNYGRVKSLERVRQFGRGFVTFPEKFLNIVSNPYSRVTLSKNSKIYQKTIHRLVATAFIPNLNSYPVVMHIDDNPENNHYLNLKWATHAMNSNDMAKKGRARNQYTSIT